MAELDEYTRVPASSYEGILQNTNFSGHMKTASLKNSLGLGMAATLLAAPAAYMINSYNQKSLYTKGKPLFTGAGNTKGLMMGAGAGGVLAGMGLDKIIKMRIK